MTSFADTPVQRPNPLVRAETWLDQRGRFAWIFAMVLGFILFWPVGLAFLGYMVWQDKFAMGGCARKRRTNLRGASGNAAFDAYRAETIRRLEDEQAAFEDFLKRLREARDKSEFDQSMEDRARRLDTSEA